MLVTGALDGHQPDYYKPYAPISFDKETYSWTDKVHITIVSPAWNSNEYGIDTIGDDSQFPIKISTSSHNLSQYKLVETSANSGIFSGEVTLTGFSHDVDGDGKTDTNPRTGGSGPNGGFLETKRDDGLTLSFEFAEGVVLTKSAHISWNVGQIEFSKTNYLTDEQVIVKVIDPDMNLNPDAVDNIKIDASSDSDVAGVNVVATETSDDSGIFEATLRLSQNEQSNANRLHAKSGDTIIAKYKDMTLPAPYSIDDEEDISTNASVGTFTEHSLLIDKIYLSDSLGKQIQQPHLNQKLQIITPIQNTELNPQNFINIIQITSDSGSVVSISWITGTLDKSQKFEISQSWLPKQKGQYTIEAFVWKSFDDPRPLSKKQIQQIIVQ
jgi:hypothetical protein